MSEKIIKTMLDASVKIDTSEKKVTQIVNPAESPESGQNIQHSEKQQEQKKPETSSKEENIYYARCNLKVIKGNYITWVNWQSTPTFIPVGAKLKVTRSGSNASLVNTETGSSYTLDIGADGDAFLEKFVTKKPVDLNKYPAEGRTSIRNTVARIGMTKRGIHSNGALLTSQMPGLIQ